MLRILRMISATILTHNNEATIAETLDSLQGLVQDFVIIDDGSSDTTLDIVRKKRADARIFHRALQEDFASQRNFALDHCLGEWVVIIDSDEILTPELAASIRSAVDKNEGEAYGCTRYNENFAGYTAIALKRPILMRRHLRFQYSLHEQLSVPLRSLPGNLVHRCWFGTEDFINDLHAYSGYKACPWLQQGRRYPLAILVCRQVCTALFYFIQHYIGERRYRQGWKGLLYCLAWSSEELFAGMKYIELMSDASNKRPK